ncbi:hypothetical protein GCM10009105_06120 [Dokdonella soli]|uniref:Uncharacterized protein n=1 Tax=Dokdonella soli TaxID=529810 RepID=A0ABN1ICS7_9GAMM
MWAAAIERATALAEAAIQSERTQLVGAHETVACDRAAKQAECAVASETTQRAREALALVEARCSDLQRLTDQQASQLVDLAAQRDTSTRDREALSSENANGLLRQYVPKLTF